MLAGPAKSAADGRKCVGDCERGDCGGTVRTYRRA